MNITEHDIQKIVQSVMKNVEGALAKNQSSHTNINPIKMKSIHPHDWT